MIPARNFMPALPSWLSMPPRLATSSNACSRPLPSELPVLRDALKSHRSTLVPKLWTVLDAASRAMQSLLPAASALASYAPDDGKWEPLGGKVAQALVTVNPVFLGSWLDALRPVRVKLTSPLATLFRDRSRPESEHTLATSILADFAGADPDLIADLLMDADPKAYQAFFHVAQRQESMTVPLLQAELARKAAVPESTKDSERVKDRLAERQARRSGRLAPHGKSRGSLAPAASQCRPPAAELHRQLAQSSRSGPQDPRPRA